ncbi:hypothetical protein F2Q68_00005042 [Brassica cretica]|uniref:Uncharacterized protein n=1 Tax=Brassica cretica TaxID=69181 RepID=A0A8S9JEM0_BRACR|nr:hypothetical protein F2Q68_00005042 [Brassica cretica]
MHATGPCGQTCGGRGVSLHGARPCIQTVFENSYSADFESAPGEESRYLEVGSWQMSGSN